MLRSPPVARNLPDRFVTDYPVIIKARPKRTAKAQGPGRDRRAVITIVTDDQVLIRFSPDQPRDEHGRFGEGGAEASVGDFDGALSKAAAGGDALSMAALTVDPSPEQAAALSRMGGDGAYVVNADLREQDGFTSTERNAATVAQIDSLMTQSSLRQDAVVYRRAQVRDVFGADVEKVGDLTGLSWRDNGYVSTSTQPRADLSGSMNMRILAPAGTPGFSHPALDNDEVLLGRGLTFEIVADNRSEDNVGGPVDVVVHS
jgi:ADP-ribosyltransferase exoenzyme